MFSISLRNTATQNRKSTLIIKMLILFARTIITSTARASFVFLSHVFFWGLFSKE